MPSIGPAELIVILVIALLVLGPKKLPEVGKSLGKGMREFKESISSPGDSHDGGEPAAPRERRPPAQVGAPPAEPFEATPAVKQGATEDR